MASSPVLIIALYHQTKKPVSFWCRRRLNPRSLIQSSDTLPVDLVGTHNIVKNIQAFLKIIDKYIIISTKLSTQLFAFNCCN